MAKREGSGKVKMAVEVAEVDVSVDSPLPPSDPRKPTPFEADIAPTPPPILNPPLVPTLSPEQLLDAENWQRERIENRLRSDYERAGVQLSQLVDENLETPLRLNAIRILGTKATRPGFLANILAPYLPPVSGPSYLYPTSASSQKERPTTLHSLLLTTSSLSSLLSQYDIFSSIEAGLEKPPSVLSEDSDVDLVLRVRELPRYFLKTSTDVGDGEGNATATARIRNTFGGAELLEGNLSYGTRTKAAFQLRLETPLIAHRPDVRGDVSVFGNERDLSYYAACGIEEKGVQTRVKTASRWGFHEFTYDAILRTIQNVKPHASLSVRDAAGSSLKSAVAHTFVTDSRDDNFMATTGRYLKLRQEYAGLGGDAQFFKAEGEYSVSRPLAPNYSISFGIKSGLLLPLSSSGKSLFPDRMHAGGPTSVRLFRPNSLGPRDANDFLGGDLFWTSGVSLVTPLWGKPQWPVKGHFFVNGGKVAAEVNASSLKNLLSQPSVSAGAGLIYRHSLVRVEVNLGLPIAMGEKEGGVKGFQFGLGVSFL